MRNEVLIYSYIAGHGLEGREKYLMLNESSEENICYNIENVLRKLSDADEKSCKVFAVYDICREKIDRYPQLVPK